MSDGNGGRRVTFWIVQALYGLVLLAGSSYVAAQNERIARLEEFRSSVSVDMSAIKWDVKGLRTDLCRTEGKVDDLMEWFTKRRQFRTPCP